MLIVSNRFIIRKALIFSILLVFLCSAVYSGMIREKNVLYLYFENETDYKDAEKLIAEEFKRELGRAGIQEVKILQDLDKALEEKPSNLFYGVVKECEEGSWSGRFKPTFMKHKHPIVSVDIRLENFKTGETKQVWNLFLDASETDVIKDYVVFIRKYNIKDYSHVVTSFGTLEDDYRLAAVEIPVKKLIRFVCHEVVSSYIQEFSH